jgi:hypothetical protein
VIGIKNWKNVEFFDMIPVMISPNKTVKIQAIIQYPTINFLFI